MNRKLLFTLSLGFNAACILIFASKRYYYTYAAIGPSVSLVADRWNLSRGSELKTLPIDSADIVFVGNSLTEGFPVNEVFHSQHVKNRGIGWNQSKHILERIGVIAAGHPRKIFLEVGINDIENNVPLDTVLANYHRIIRQIRSISSRTIVYVQSVFPVCKDAAPFERQVDDLNRRLRSYCQADGLPYIDVYSRLVRNGSLDTTFTIDGVHLKGTGYQQWKMAIDSLVN